MKNSQLWAVCSYFNPARFRRRLRNYAIFRRRLRVPLVTVELSFDDRPFELTADDADILVQLRGDVMWQKERLLNVAMEHLPDDCTKVIWMDADVVIPDPEWPARVSQALDEYSLVQPFSAAYNLPPDAAPTSGDFSNATRVGTSLVRYVEQFGSQSVFDPNAVIRVKDNWTTARNGLAWAAQLEFIQKHGLYDACITGGGDRTIGVAVYQGLESLPLRQVMSDAAKSYFMRWGEAFSAHFQRNGNITYIDTPIYHLWHGSFEDRGHAHRQKNFSQFQFDPAADLELSENGCWRWNSDKPEMHRYVRDYFFSRKEDD